MSTETLVLLAVGAAIVVVPMIPWSKILGAAKSIDIIPEGPSLGDSLGSAVTTLRYYFALQGPEVRIKAFEALDVVDGYISEQPIFPFNGEATDEQ